MTLDDTPWGAEGSILNTELAINGAMADVNLARIDIDAEEMTTYHRHDDAHTILLLQDGLVELRVDDDYVELTPGDAHVVEAGTPHQLQNINDEVAQLLEIRVPFDRDDEDIIEDPYL